MIKFTCEKYCYIVDYCIEIDRYLLYQYWLNYDNQKIKLTIMSRLIF